MRAGKCMICGSLLPEGGRRDRRYCRESCRAMAYRQRRDAPSPDTGRQSSAKQPASSNDIASAVLALAQQLKQLREDLAAVTKRLSILETQTQSARRVPAVEQAREVMQTLQTLFGAGQEQRTAQTSAPSASTATSDLTVRHDVSPTRISKPDEESAVKLPPWMTASPQNPAHLVPKWTLWPAGFLDGLNAYVERVLENMPESVARNGETLAAEKMRQWLSSDKQSAMQVASLMARRIIATSPIERQSAQQRLALAKQVSTDLEDSATDELSGDKQRMLGFLRSAPHLPALMGVCLAVALRNFDRVPDRTDLSTT